MQPGIRGAVQGIGMQHEHAPRRAAVGGGDRGLAATRRAARSSKIRKAPDLALADALHLGGMPGIDLGRGRALQRLPHDDTRPGKRLGEPGFERRLSRNPPLDIADHPPQPDLQETDVAVAPLELPGMRIPARSACRSEAPKVGLAMPDLRRDAAADRDAFIAAFLARRVWL